VIEKANEINNPRFNHLTWLANQIGNFAREICLLLLTRAHYYLTFPALF
jgi:hypothetical protein